jgi:hypothetical protein
MTPWLKIYLKAYRIHKEDDWQCESCGKTDKLQNFDLHHINSRSISGGQKVANRIENLMVLCRPEHIEKGDDPDWRHWLFSTHKLHMEQHGVKFDREWIEEQIRRNAD